jgi:7-carboxy-7-deazaguanine synthase
VAESPSSDLIEVFSAIQGEGPIVGRRQIFLRFGHCDVVCRYCDTPLCHVELPECRLERRAGGREFERQANPMSLAAIETSLERLAADLPHHSVSLTGGEPLLHAEMIRALGPCLKSLGLLGYLETNGHLVDELLRALPALDIVGMDIKLESATGFPARFDDNRRFLAACVDAGLDVFAKVVLDAATSIDEIDGALAVVLDTAAQVPVVFQPVTPFRGVGTPPEPEQLLAWNERALRAGAEALVIPQTHKMIGQK